MAEKSNTESVGTGLIQIREVSQFSSKPHSGGNTHVVIMQKTGGAEKYYMTLRSDQDRLSLGEQVWGNYVCYVVDLGWHKLTIQREFTTVDRITKVQVKAEITYQAIDGKKVVLSSDDAVRSMREDIEAILQRVIEKITMTQTTPEVLEGQVLSLSSHFANSLGLSMPQVRIQVDWDKEVIARLKEEQARSRKHEIEDIERKRKAKIEDEDRSRAHNLEIQDVRNIDQILEELNMAALPPDMKLKLMSMERKEAYAQIANFIQEQRNIYMQERKAQVLRDHETIKTLIDRGVLEKMDLTDFGQALLERYTKGSNKEEMDPSLFFGAAQARPMLGGESGRKTPRLPDISQTDPDDANK